MAKVKRLPKDAQYVRTLDNSDKVYATARKAYLVGKDGSITSLAINR